MDHPGRGRIRCNHRDCRHKAPNGTCQLLEHGQDVILNVTGQCEMRVANETQGTADETCQQPGCALPGYARCAYCEMRLCMLHVQLYPPMEAPAQDSDLQHDRLIENDQRAIGHTPLCPVCYMQHVASPATPGAYDEGTTPFDQADDPPGDFDWPKA